MENEYDAIDAGIEPGGLRTRSYIRLLICYIIDSLDKPVKKEHITTAMMQYGIANYFEIIDGFIDLENKENIICIDSSQELYSLTKSGRLIASSLSDELPLTIRERTFSAVSELLLQEKNREENTAEIIKKENGYIVDCHIGGDDNEDLFSFQLYVPDSKQARIVKRNFQNNPDMIYKMMIASITGNSEFAQQTLEEIKNKGLRRR